MISIFVVFLNDGRFSDDCQTWDLSRLLPDLPAQQSPRNAFTERKFAKFAKFYGADEGWMKRNDDRQAISRKGTFQ